MTRRAWSRPFFAFLAFFGFFTPHAPPEDEGPAYTRPNTSMQYSLIYSADNGVTWKHMQDNSPATPGVLPAPALRVNDAVPGGDETYTWATPVASFPAGTYRIRIESYRTAARLHYSFHEERIYVSR